VGSSADSAALGLLLTNTQTVSLEIPSLHGGEGRKGEGSLSFHVLFSPLTSALKKQRRNTKTSSFPSRAATCSLVYSCFLCLLYAEYVAHTHAFAWWMPCLVVTVVALTCFARVLPCAISVFVSVALCLLFLSLSLCVCHFPNVMIVCMSGQFGGALSIRLCGRRDSSM